MCLPGLVPQLQLSATVADGPQGRRQHLVDRFGAQTPPQHQQVQRPLAVVVVSGVTTSTLLTLIVLPVLYSWFGDRQGKERPTG